MPRPKPAVLAFALLGACALVGCGPSNPQSTSALQVTSASLLPAGRVNSLYTSDLSVAGGVPPYTWTASGSMPSGLSLSSSGSISGTPTTTGSFNFFATVTDAAHPAASQSVALSLTVANQLQITTTILPNTSPGVTYSVALNATGGVPPYSWSISGGTLPTGLTLSAATGVISGISNISGNWAFSVKVNDSLSYLPPVTTSLAIDVNPAPPRDAAIYTTFLQSAVAEIRSDGSIAQFALAGFNADGGVALSPSLPLIFATSSNQQGGTDIQSLLINPDYSTTLVSTTNIASTFNVPGAAVDPTGSNLYVLGSVIENESSPANEIPGILIFTANASPQTVGDIAIADVSGSSSLVFTPDGTIGFLSTCNSSSGSSVSAYSRASDGMLKAGPTYPLTGYPGTRCPSGLAVSPDGKYLATEEVQIYSIATDGSLTPVLSAPFIAVFGQVQPGAGNPICPSGIMWDSTGSYVLVSADCGGYPGGIAVMSFLGGTLRQTYYPAESFGVRLHPHQVGTFVYGVIYTLRPQFGGIVGYGLQNGQLIPVPGSPYSSYGSIPIMIY